MKRICAFSAALAAISLTASCDDLELDSIEQADVVNPPDLHGTLSVKAPVGGQLNGWQPGTPPKYGPNNVHVFNDDLVHVYRGGVHLKTVSLGSNVSLTPGSYQAVVNDTAASFSIQTKKTTTVQVGRVEVTDVEGTFKIDADAGDSSGGSNVLNAKLPTGVGINVMPGSYKVNVTYQSHTKSFDVTVNGVERVDPDNLRGYLRVLAPDDITLPNWQPSSPPSFGPGAQHTYDNGMYHVWRGSEYLASVPLGDSYYTPEGHYQVTVNDTFVNMTVVKQEISSIRAGRIEVTDVDGTFRIDAEAGDFSGGSNVLNAKLPTGTGITVLPGHYQIDVTYQNQTSTFPLHLVTD